MSFIASTRSFITTLLMSLLLVNCQSLPLSEEVVPAGIFTDNMVLQREMDIPIWGTATPLSQFKISFRSQEVDVNVDEEGKWQVNLKAEIAGGPESLLIMSQDTLILENVLVGEVWLGSGQSNMEMPLAGWGQILNFEDEIAAANYPEIRLLTVERGIDIYPLDSMQSQGWKICTSENIPDFSSTAYFFGRHLHTELDVPIGLIHSSWGGTPIEAWIGPQSLKTTPKYGRMLRNLDKVLPELDSVLAAQPELNRFEYLQQKWMADMLIQDRGYSTEGPVWANPELDDSDWSSMQLPATWEQRGYPSLDGIGWFRKSVDLEKSWSKGTTTLLLSAVDDVDSTWFNGVFIGTDNVWDGIRKYEIPSDIIRSGKNTITVRVQDDQGGGGIWGDPEFLRLDHSSQKSLSLVGEWLFKVGLDFQELETPTVMSNNPNYPTVLSNAMIEPVIPYGIRGVIWYQGETNAGRAYEYRSLLPLLIKDWRFRWKQDDFPFLIVQLANYMDRNPQPEEHSWAELREAQLLSLSVPNTALTVSIDIGDAEDIHPKNKQDVGRRLALNALGLAYNKAGDHSGPLYRGHSIHGSEMHIEFDQVESGFQTRDDIAVQGVAIAGPDSTFIWAEARIENNQLIVNHPSIKTPIAVRYGWASNPDANLVNGKGLPASPFRTDDWPGITTP